MSLLALVLLAALESIVSAVEPSNDRLILSSSNIVVTWKTGRESAMFPAFTNGATAAECDFSNGTARLYLSGFVTMAHSPWADYLLANYAVTCVDAGCGMFPGETEYNARMKELLRLKYQKDIFAEADQWMQSHPEAWKKKAQSAHRGLTE